MVAPLLLSCAARADIQFDSASSQSVNAATLNLNHAVGGGADRLLVVSVAVEAAGGSADLTAPPTFDGVDMTKAIDRTVGSSYDMNTEIWYMLEADLPAAGSYQLSIQASGADDITAVAISVTGAAQQGPEATAGSDDGEGGAPSIQTQVTTLSDRAWIFDCVGSGNAISGFSPDAGQTERGDSAAASSRGAAGTEEKTTAGLETQGWTASGSNRISHVVAAFAPTVTTNYRSIGTDSGVLYSAGDASIAAGSKTVTFGSGASLPANVGAGDKLTISGGGLSTITLDNVTSQTFSNQVTSSLNHAIGGGADRLLVVCTGAESFPPVAVTGVTYNGVALTPAGFQEGAAGDLGQRVEMWYMLEANLPGAGTYQVQVTYAASQSPGVAVVSLTGAAQQAPEATAGNECSSCTSITTPITTLTNGAWVISNVGNGQSGSYTGHGAGQTERWDQTPSSAVHSGTTRPVATAGPVTISETASGSANRQALFAAAFAPAGLPDSTLFVISRDSATQVTVHDAATVSHAGDPYTIERAYNTLQAWEDDREGDLITVGCCEVGVCYNDGPFTAPLLADGSTTDSTHFMRLTVADGQRHNGVASAGTRIDAGGISGQDVIRATHPFEVEWLEITDFKDGTNDGIEFGGTTAQSRGEYLLIHDFDGGVGVRFFGPGLIRNSMVYDGDNHGIRAAGSSNVTVHNCTVYAIGTNGVRGNASSTVDIRNTISVGCLSDDMDLRGTVAYFGNNMYTTFLSFDPDAYQGGNQSPPADIEDLFVSIFPSAEDLHLEPGGHDAGNKGLDLSGLFTGDIDGATRVGAYDLGADEAIPGGYQPHLISWREIEPN